MKTLDYTDIPKIAIERGIARFWHDRILDMARHASIVSGREYGDNVKAGFKALRVAKDWPLRGTITLYREDGAVFHLYLTKGKKWRVTRNAD